MSKFIGIALAIFAVVFMTAGTACATDRITKEDLKEILGQPGIVIIDVRTHGDYIGTTMKISGSVREDPTNVISWAGKYSKDLTIILYCA
jgi:rhodanese-related sulfurtransferase